jgi:hypothetical protein
MCVTDKRFSEKIGKQARHFVEERFDNKKVISSLINFYQNEL